MPTYAIEFGAIGNSRPVPPLTLRADDPNIVSRTVVDHARPHITPVLTDMGRPELANAIFRMNRDRTMGQFLWLDLAGGKGAEFLPARITTTPERIQRKRTKGWRKPDETVIVSRPSRFGNPFTLAGAMEWLGAETPEQAREACHMAFRSWVRGSDQWWMGPEAAATRKRLLGSLPELRGKDLACYCPLPEPGKPDHCHAAVLLELANQRTA